MCYTNIIWICFYLGFILTANNRESHASLGSCDNNGQQYYKKVPGVCLHVHCVKGQEVLLQNHMCQDLQGNCHEQGQFVTISQCMTKTCVLKEKKLFYEFSAQACTIDGNCVNVNSSVIIGCITYRCVAVQHGESISLKTVAVDIGCRDDKGVCHKVGDKIKQDNCIEVTCKLTATGIGFELTRSDCYDPEHNMCRGAGVVWTNSACHQLVCEKTSAASGSMNLKIKLKSAGCPGENAGECHTANDGKSFIMKRFNKIVQSCQCITAVGNPYKLQYRCTGHNA